MLKEPHAARRANILKTHPTVAALQGPEWRSKYMATGLILAHAGTAVCVAPRAVTSGGSVALFALAYIIGATLTQALFLANHELAHNLFFARGWHNRAFSLAVNLPLVVPFVIAFRGYHLEHHQHQGVVGVDTDLPTEWEQRVVRGRLAKTVWLASQIVAYAVRPMVVKRQPLTAWHALNACMQVVATSALWWWSVAPVATMCYLVLSLVFAGGLHPCAGHFLSEHYTMHSDASQETTSYYGSLNRLTWNVGYHNEHHDFPRVPWSRLPKVRAEAPEYYDTLHACSSWCGIQWAYVFRPEVGPWSRVRRRTTGKSMKE